LIAVHDATFNSKLRRPGSQPDQRERRIVWNAKTGQEV